MQVVSALIDPLDYISRIIDYIKII